MESVEKCQAVAPMFNELDKPCIKISKPDNWADKRTFKCETCMFFVMKADIGEMSDLGRCRRHAPTMSGFPVVYCTDWCGDHKLK